jgi:uncharacterized protein YecE (DUF72 family)
MTQTRTACAGWSLNRDVAADFPAGASHLERYAAVFNAVEINTSFYRPHQPKTDARWADSVPDDFRFAVKLPRSITHEQRLADVDGLLAQFAGETAALGHKLGCVLVQLPPSVVLVGALAVAFWRTLRARFDCRRACEARHASWFASDATSLLQQHGVTRVIADPPAGKPGPYLPTSDAAYVRLHGSPRIYYSSYDEAYLRSVAAWLKGRDSWCVFDNTASGAALHNALTLQKIQRSG